MTERSDITVDWGLSPRLIEVALPSTELSNQDAHDTLNSNTLQAGMSDDSLENLDDDVIISSAGKENLGGGTEVGITSTYQNAQVAFGRTDPRSTTVDTVTTAGTNQVICLAATFQTDGVQRGDWVINWTDQSVTEVLEVISQTTLRVRTPSGVAAATDDFAVNDVISVWEVSECSLVGGNHVAVDNVPANINPLFTTFGRFATRTSAASATTSNQDSLNFATYQGKITIDTVGGSAGTTFPIGTEESPVNNLADAQTIANSTGIRVLFFKSAYTFLATDNIDEYTIRGEGPSLTVITLTAGVSSERTQFENCELTGDVGGAINVINCHCEDITNVGSALYETEFRRCLLEPGTVFQLSSTPGLRNIHIRDCDSGSPGDTPVILDYNSADVGMTVRKYAGGLRFQNITTAEEISIDGDGHITVDASCTAGNMALRGDLRYTNNGTGTFTLVDQTTARTVWEQEVETGLTAEELMRVITAAVAGKASGLDILNPVYRDVNDTKDRITATTDASGNRSAVTLNVVK